jgi:3',5'-cyclic AMP phosphodiesterase CpdA
MPPRFIVLSDTHFLEPELAAKEKTWWNRILETRCVEIGAALVRTINRLEPEFVVHCGDFTGQSDLGSYALGVEIMNRLNSPWYVVPGNHDTSEPGVRVALAERCQQPGEDCYFARDLAGLRFIFLDVAYWTSTRGETTPYLDHERFDRGEIAGMGLSPQELPWLEQELAAASNPVVLVSHAPLGYQPSQPIKTLPRGEPPSQPRTPVVDIMGDVLQRAAVRDLIRRYPKVKAAFAGHWHLCDMIREDGVAFCQTAALREYPFEFKLVTVESGRLAVTTLGLDDDNFQRQSYIEEWGNRWVAGTEADRTFQVQLE